MNKEKINVGDTVIPKTSAGLWLADRPTNGEEDQHRETVCEFKGVGEVIEVEDFAIDYDLWAGFELFPLIGKANYRCCKVKCKKGIGWAGEGALLKHEEKVFRSN